jgi:hypothetical protein
MKTNCLSESADLIAQSGVIYFPRESMLLGHCIPGRRKRFGRSR